MKAEPIIVVKVGGSLFDAPGLKDRLRRFVKKLRTKRLLLIPGGGEPADYIRRLQPIHGFSDELAHDLALRAMSFQGDILRRMLPKTCGAMFPSEVEAAWAKNLLPLLDPDLILSCVDHFWKARVPKTWALTSDSIAAAVAIYLKADKLILLKSRPAKKGLTWAQHGEDGLVDVYFPRLAARLPEVEVVDFRGRSK